MDNICVWEMESGQYLWVGIESGHYMCVGNREGTIYVCGKYKVDNICREEQQRVGNVSANAQ